MHPFYQQQNFQIRTETVEQIVFPEHLHPHTELLYVLDGTASISVGEQIFAMGRGDCAVIFPGKVHSYHPCGFNRVFLLIFDTALCGPFQYSLNNCQPLIPCVSASCLPEDIPLAIRRLSETDPHQNPDLSAAWIQVVLALVLPFMELTKQNQPKNEDLTYQLVRYMSEHFREPVTLDSLAKSLHVNKYYLSHTFSEKLHMSFPRYLNYLRAEYAAGAIQSSQKSLSHIWEEAGFSSQRSFNRAFLEAKGMSPLAYRKKI